ncbi:MAG TPA: PQ-loop domain-containing transporter [Nitrospiraceae bacterium]|nr:PQ-loop domain-containing transporter [Nitrospiraceae bacterium]
MGAKHAAVGSEEGREAVTTINLLGFAAGAFATCAFWPQLQKTWVTKSAGDVSLGMLAIFSTGVCRWFSRILKALCGLFGLFRLFVNRMNRIN